MRKKILGSNFTLLFFFSFVSLVYCGGIDTSLQSNYNSMKSNGRVSGYQDDYNFEGNSQYKSKMEEKTRSIENNSMFQNYESMANSNNSKYNTFYKSTIKGDNSNVKLYEENTKGLRESYNERFGSMDFSNDSMISGNNKGSTQNKTSSTGNSVARGISERTYETNSNSNIIDGEDGKQYYKTNIKETDYFGTRTNVEGGKIYKNTEIYESENKKANGYFQNALSVSNYDTRIYNKNIKTEKKEMWQNFLTNTLSTGISVVAGASAKAYQIDMKSIEGYNKEMDWTNPNNAIELTKKKQEKINSASKQSEAYDIASTIGNIFGASGRTTINNNFNIRNNNNGNNFFKFLTE